MTTIDARTIIGEEHWEEFIRGLTVGKYPDGTTNYYVWDVINFCKLHNIEA